jgi:hypothetical protein
MVDNGLFVCSHFLLSIFIKSHVLFLYSCHSMKCESMNQYVIDFFKDRNVKIVFNQKQETMITCSTQIQVHLESELILREFYQMNHNNNHSLYPPLSKVCKHFLCPVMTKSFNFVILTMCI